MAVLKVAYKMQTSNMSFGALRSLSARERRKIKAYSMLILLTKLPKMVHYMTSAPSINSSAGLEDAHATRVAPADHFLY